MGPKTRANPMKAASHRAADRCSIAGLAMSKVAAMRDNAAMGPFELFGHFSRKQNEVELADLIDKNPTVGDWKNPAWRS